MRTLILFLAMTMSAGAWTMTSKAPICTSYHDLIVAYKASQENDLDTISSLMMQNKCFLTQKPYDVSVKGYAGEIMGTTIWKVNVVNTDLTVFVPETNIRR